MPGPGQERRQATSGGTGSGTLPMGPGPRGPRWGNAARIEEMRRRNQAASSGDSGTTETTAPAAETGTTGTTGTTSTTDTAAAATTTAATSSTTAATSGTGTNAAQTGSGIDEAALTRVGEACVAVAPADLADHARTAIPGILRQAALAGVRNANQVAYLLATAQHESRFGKPLYSRSQSLVEDRNEFSQTRRGYSATVHTNNQTVTGKTEDELETKYWDSAYGGRLGNRQGTTDARDFRGRGYVQLTGRDNYSGMSTRLNNAGFSYTVDGVTYGGAGNPAIDLTAHPDHVNRVPELAARVLVVGMKDGAFTGRALGDYVNDQQTDYTNARAVVNGDTATNGGTVAGYARTYQGALGAWSSVFAAQTTR